MKKEGILKNNYILILLFLVIAVFIFVFYGGKDIFLMSPAEEGYGYGYGDEVCIGSEIGFSKGTKILMSEDYKNIEDVQVGEYVTGYNALNEEKVSKQIQEVVIEERCDAIKIVFNQGNDIITTKGLFIFTNEGWKEVGGDESPLEIGDEIINDDSLKKVVDIVFLENTISIYYLKVKDDVYFIDDPIRVSNIRCIPDCSERECGDDGCGGICGVCENNNCTNGICAKEETEEPEKKEETKDLKDESPQFKTKKPAIQDNDSTKNIQLQSKEQSDVLKYILIGISTIVILILLSIVGYLIYKLLKH